MPPQVVAFRYGRESAATLRKHKVGQVVFKSVKGMGHTVNKKVMRLVLKFLTKRLSPIREL